MKKIAIGDKRFVITKNLIMMLVMLVVIFVAIFAWYSNNDTVTASGTQISAKSADNVELAVPEKDSNGDDIFPISNDKWTTNLEFSDSGYLKNFVKDITSNGIQFAVPNFEAAKGLKDGRKVIADDVWTEGLSSKVALSNNSTLDDDQYNYISLDFYVRSKSKDINVTSESFLAAGSETGFKDSNNKISAAKALKGTDIYRCSSYGAQEHTEEAFSSDAVIGAMRVSLVGAPVNAVNADLPDRTETSPDSTLRFLWLPRPDIHLNTADNSNNWTLTTEINTSNQLAAETYCHSFYEGKIVEGTSVKKGLTAKTYYDDQVYTPSDTTGKSTPDYFFVSNGVKKYSNDVSLPSLGRSAAIAGDALESSKNIEFTDGDEKINGYYVYKYTLNIWIEGEDAEARRSMNNGVFSLELDFGT